MSKQREARNLAQAPQPVAGAGAEAKNREPNGLVHTALTKGIAPFVAKSSVVMTGWMLLNALTQTQSMLFIGHTDTLLGLLKELLLDLIVFGFMTLLGAAVSQKLLLAIPDDDRAVRIYKPALALFPAWKWRDVDLTISRVLMFFVHGKEQRAIMIPLILFVTSICLQMLAENVAQNNSASFEGSAAAMVKASLALGLALSLDSQLAPLLAPYRVNLSAALLEALIKSAIVVVVHILYHQKDDARSRCQNNCLSSIPVALRNFMNKFMPLVLTTITLIAGISWDHFCDDFFASWKNQGPFHQLMVSFSLTVITGIICGVMSVGHQQEEVHDLVAAVAGFNVGLTWCDFALSVFQAVFSKRMRNGSEDVLFLWGYSVLAVLCVLVWAWAMERLLQYFDKLAIEADEQLAELEEQLEDELQDDDSSSEMESEDTKWYTC